MRDKWYRGRACSREAIGFVEGFLKILIRCQSKAYLIWLMEPSDLICMFFEVSPAQEQIPTIELDSTVNVWMIPYTKQSNSLW